MHNLTTQYHRTLIYIYYMDRSEAEVHILFVGDRPVHKLPFGPKCNELFVILYSIHANLSDDMFLLLYF